MPAPTAPVPLRNQRNIATAPVVTIATASITLAGGAAAGAAATSTYTFTAGNDSEDVRDLCDLMDRAVRNGSAVVS